MRYSGIEINEVQLLIHNFVSLLILFFLIAIAVAAFFVLRNQDNPKTRERMKRLKAEAGNDPAAKKQLVKLERKQKRRIREGLVMKLLTFSLLTLMILLDVFVAGVPGWTDYVKKDYIVYDGELSGAYEVKRYIRDSAIVLPDGTKISGALGLNDGMHTEKIIYSKRTKIALGRENGE